MNDKDTHSELVRLFYEYIKSNIEWEEKETHRAGARSRKILSDIRVMASDRRQEIQEVRYKKPKQFQVRKPRLSSKKDAQD